MNIKKVLTLSLCAVMAFSAAACADNADKTVSQNSGAQIPNPFTEYPTLEDAVKEAGFNINLPERIEGFDNCVFRFSKDIGLLEIIYENSSDTITFRKSAGEGDISGNYNKFSEKNDVDIDGITVTMKGDNGKVNTATWNKGSYAYSIDCTAAVEKVTMTGYIKTVNTENQTASASQDVLDDKKDTFQLSNPFVSCNDMAGATAMAGFEMTVPNTPDRMEVWENNMIQVFYGEDGEDLLIRKAVGD